MPTRTFLWFVMPTLTAMILFIALPIVSVFIQSLHVEHEQVLITTESCGPFGCEETTTVDQEATEALRAYAAGVNAWLDEVKVLRGNKFAAGSE